MPPDTQRTTAFNRRHLLQGAGLGVIAGSGLFSLNGCSSSSTSNREIQVWDLFSGADGANMVTMLNNAEASNSGIKIKHVTLAWGSPYYTKLAMASAGGRPPQAAIMHLSRLAGYAPGGLLDAWDLDLLAEFGVRESDFAPALWKRCTYQDKLYALPLDTHPFVTFYNKDLVSKANLLDDNGRLKPITNPDAMLAAHKAIVSAGTDTGVAFGFLGDTAQSWRLFWGLYGQTGGAYRFDSNRPAEIDEAKALTVLDFMIELTNLPGGAKNMDYGGAITSFNNRKAGMLLSGEWEMPGMRKILGTALDATPMPTMFGTAASYADSHSWVLPRNGIGSDPAYRRDVYAAISSVVKDALVWAQAGHIPGYSPVRSTSEYKKLIPQAHYASAGDHVFLDPSNWFTGAGSEFQNQMSQPMNQALRGQVKAKPTLDAMMTSLTALLATPNPA